jgi:hypothetical protein
MGLSQNSLWITYSAALLTLPWWPLSVYARFFPVLSHHRSPLRAMLALVGASLGTTSRGRYSKDLTWIQLGADHFSPWITGQLPWRVSGSGPPSTWRLKKSTASPFTGFTACNGTSKSMSLAMFRLGSGSQGFGAWCFCSWRKTWCLVCARYL